MPCAEKGCPSIANIGTATRLCRVCDKGYLPYQAYRPTLQLTSQNPHKATPREPPSIAACRSADAGHANSWITATVSAFRILGAGTIFPIAPHVAGARLNSVRERQPVRICSRDMCRRDDHAARREDSYAFRTPDFQIRRAELQQSILLRLLSRSGHVHHANVAASAAWKYSVQSTT